MSCIRCYLNQVNEDAVGITMEDMLIGILQLGEKSYIRHLTGLWSIGVHN